MRSIWQGSADLDGEVIYFRRRTPRSSLHLRHATWQRPARERLLGPLTVETPIMTVKEARKLWGKGSRAYTDDEIRALIRDYETLARQAVRAYLVR